MANLSLGLGLGLGAVAPLQVPITNGVVRSFGHVRLNVAGIDQTGGFKSIKRSRKRTREMVMSNNPDPVGKTLGENAYQCSIVFYLDWLLNLIQVLGPGYGDIPFTTYISYVGNNLTPYTDKVLNCTLDGFDGNDSAGTTALVVEVELNPTKILFTGLDDVADPLQGVPL